MAPRRLPDINITRFALLIALLAGIGLASYRVSSAPVALGVSLTRFASLDTGEVGAVDRERGALIGCRLPVLRGEEPRENRFTESPGEEVWARALAPPSSRPA
jgi:hypothetical protein